MLPKRRKNKIVRIPKGPKMGPLFMHREIVIPAAEMKLLLYPDAVCIYGISVDHCAYGKIAVSIEVIPVTVDLQPLACGIPAGCILVPPSLGVLYTAPWFRTRSCHDLHKV